MTRKLINFLIAFLFCLVQAGRLLATNPGLEERLIEIDAQRNDTLTSVEALEQRCLKLLEEFQEPSEQGRIHAEIAYIYAQDGLSSPYKTIRYSRNALEYPLGIDIRSRLHVHLADALQLLYQNAQSEDTSVALWKEGVKACMFGLEFLLGQNLPEERQKLPVVTPFSYDGPRDDSIYTELLRKNQEQMAARDRIMMRNTLILYRDALMEKCIYLYSREPKATDEFEQLAREILGDEEAVKELLSRIEP